MQSLIRSKSAGVTGGRGTAGAGPGRVGTYVHMCSTWGALKGHERYFLSGHMKIWKIAKHTPCSQRIALGLPHKLSSTKVGLAIDSGEYGEGACAI